MAESVRPTKKQRELLTFIEDFIAQHGYSPSYREIMTGLNYTSVATVALHVNSLIKRGHLRKRDGKARSLEVVNPTRQESVGNNEIQDSQEKWLVEKVEHFFTQHEALGIVTAEHVRQSQVLVHALQVLGLDAAAQSFIARLGELRQRSTS